MADKEKDDGKADKAARAAKVDKSPEAQARADKAAAAKQKAVAKKAAESAEKKPREPEEKVTPRLRTHFDQVVRKALTEQFGYKNPMQVPRVDKIVLNMGIGEAVADRKKVEQAAEAMAAIAGQKPVITKSKKSIAGFKIRTGYPVGTMVTLLPGTFIGGHRLAQRGLVGRALRQGRHPGQERGGKQSSSALHGHRPRFAVVGSITVAIGVMRFAGKPDFAACSRISASLGAW